MVTKHSEYSYICEYIHLLHDRAESKSYFNSCMLVGSGAKLFVGNDCTRRNAVLVICSKLANLQIGKSS